MRLINVHDYSITEFIGQNIPLYAILSHTRGADEVSFQDMQSISAARQKEGFKKINFCCEQAKRDGLGWAWVDTCFIDKTSSAELSEAINSMFRWYSQSMICYAYLDDVHFSYQTSPEDIDLDDLRGSLWFTRGWTLQELLAPLMVQFFTSDWLYIGSKKELSLLIEEITEIPEDILNHEEPILDQTVYMRMHWAARRKTTREEDMAYCLFGIFDVNLPLLYGEGRKAFHRLQEEIIKQFHDHTIFLWDVHPTQGTPGKNPMNGPSTNIYAGLLADSPNQFHHDCSVKIVDPPDGGDPIQISRKGSQMKLFLKNVTAKSIPSWPEYTKNLALHEGSVTFFLATLDYLIESRNFVVDSSRDKKSELLECTAMLLLQRRFDGSYERVLSYYETVSLKDVRANWKFSTCYICDPTWQWSMSTVMHHGYMVNLRWSGLNYGYNISRLGESTDRCISAFAPP
jgi:hypothetical protein